MTIDKQQGNRVRININKENPHPVPVELEFNLIIRLLNMIDTQGLVLLHKQQTGNIYNFQF